MGDTDTVTEKMEGAKIEGLFLILLLNHFDGNELGNLCSQEDFQSRAVADDSALVQP